MPLVVHFLNVGRGDCTIIEFQCEKGNKSHSISVYCIGINEISVFVKEKMLGFNV